MSDLRDWPHQTAVGRHLRECRVTAGLSIAAVCRETGLSRQTINHIERGLVYPSVKVLFALCRAYSISPDAALLWGECG